MKQTLCYIALLLCSVMQAQYDYEVKAIDGVNTEFDDIVCTFQKDELIFSTNDRQDFVSDYQWNEHRIFHLSRATRGKDFAHYGESKPLFPTFTYKDEGPASYDATDSTLYFSSAMNYGGSVGNNIKIFSTKWNGKAWSEPRVLPFCTALADFAHPSFDPTLKLLVFSSNKSGGQGGMDIWFSYRIPGGWTVPSNPGFPMNTRASEIFPSVFMGDIYYASNGIVQGAGYDLFCAKQKDQWSTSIQMPAPINSSGDDLMILFLNHDKGLITSNRSGGKGKDDIYIFERKRSKAEEHHFTARLEYKEQALPGAHILVTNGLKETILDANTDANGSISLEPLNLNEHYRLQVAGIQPSMYPDCALHIIDQFGRIVKTLRLNANGWVDLELLPFDYSSLRLASNDDSSILTIELEGQVYNEKPGDIGKGEPVTIVDENGMPVAIAYTNEGGSFKFNQLFPELNYTFKLSEKSRAQQVVLTDKGKSITLPVLREEAIYRRIDKSKAIELVNEKNETIYISPNDLFVINRIYYTSNSAQLTDEAKAQLDQLIIILKNNPKLRVELLSHTDARGDEQDNLQLSERRAEAAVQYLVTHGIERSRLRPKGLGESQLINHCGDGENCSDAEHAINRRTEIKLQPQ